MERRMHRPPRHFAALILCALLATAGMPQSARAAVIDCGPTLCFQYDELQAGVAAFGLPVRVGDSMQFLPAALLAASANGVGTPAVTAAFVFDRVYTLDGSNLVEIRAFEEGDYEIMGGGAVSLALGVVAQSNLVPEQVAAAGVFNATGDSGVAKIWDAVAVVNPKAGFAGPATDLRLTIDNVMQASTSSFGELAWIQKKFVVTAVGVEPAAEVPLPGTLGLLSAGLAFCAMRSRRRGPNLSNGGRG
jgi:hypothetical protein